MEKRITPVGKAGLPTTIGTLSWDEAEDGPKTSDYLIPASAIRKIQNRLRDPSTAE